MSRWKMLAILAGLTVTWNVGYATAQLFGARIAAAAPGFPFQLALLLAITLAAGHFLVLCLRIRAPRVTGTRAVTQPQEPSIDVQTIIRERNLQASPWAVAILEDDPSGPRKIRYVNPAFISLTGFDAHELVGQSGDFLSDSSPLRCDSVLWLDAQADGREAHWIAQLHRRDGTAFWGEAQFDPIRAADGSISHEIVALSDITAQVRVKEVRPPASPAAPGDPPRLAAAGH